MINIKDYQINKVIDKWTPIANKLNVEDVPNWCICMEQINIQLTHLSNVYRPMMNIQPNDTKKLDEHTTVDAIIFPIIAKLLASLINSGIQIRHNYDSGIIRRFKIENLDTDLDYEEFLESTQVNSTYLIPMENIFENGLYTMFLEDITAKCKGRVFLPLQFLHAVKTHDTNLIVKCRYGFVD